MNKRYTIVLAALLVVLVAGIAGVVTRPAPRQMTVRLSGTPGLSVAGTYIADGRAHEFSGTLPTDFSVRARRLTYTIINRGGDGELEGRLYIDGAEKGYSRTSGTNVGVRGWAERDGFLPVYWRDGVGLTTVHGDQK